MQECFFNGPEARLNGARMGSQEILDKMARGSSQWTWQDSKQECLFNRPKVGQGRVRLIWPHLAVKKQDVISKMKVQTKHICSLVSLATDLQCYDMTSTGTSTGTSHILQYILQYPPTHLLIHPPNPLLPAPNASAVPATWKAARLGGLTEVD